MAGHDVEFTIPWCDLGKADVEFEVKKDGAALGKLAISKGAVVWFPANGSIGYRMPWTKFGDVMIEKGQRGPERR